MDRSEQGPTRKIAIIADIHGNRWALEAVLQDIELQGIQQIFNLGDSLLGPLDPLGTARLLLERNIPAISGNDDRVIVVPPEHSSASLAFTLECLKPEHLNWLSSLPTSLIVAGDLFLCHATPTSDDSYLLETVSASGISLRTAAAIMADIATVKQAIILCGHSHVSRTFFLPEGKLIVNPGSVGLPAYTADLPYPHAMEAGSPHARYAVMTNTGNAWQIEHVHVAYDWEQAANIAHNHGRSDWARWLATGRAQS